MIFGVKAMNRRKRFELGDEKILKNIFGESFIWVNFWDVTNLPHLK